MMKEPIITVFVTVYNVEEYLDRFFECLLGQTMPDFEVLIIEDGSTDNSLSICRKYASDDDRIRIIPVDHIGISAARNIALENIRTEFVTSLDGDDFFEKDYLKHLIDAQRKYDADYVISNVVYLNEDLTEKWRFEPRAEGFYTEESFPDLMPELFREERLTYLFGKLFRAELMKGISVEPDVRSGSDKMINFQYFIRIKNLAVIEDYDYFNIKYTTRSVTSYRGDRFFERYYRSVRFIFDLLEQNGKLDDKMILALDERVLIIGRNAVYNIYRKKMPLEEKCRKADRVTGCEEYRTSYERQKRLGNLDKLRVDAIAPEDGGAFIKFKVDMIAQEKKDQRKKRLRELCPDFVFNLYHKTKIALGLIPPDAEE